MWLNWKKLGLSGTESIGLKKRVIENADNFIQIRLLKNEIAHEYKSDMIYAIFESVLELTPVLLDSVEKIIAYPTRFTDD